MANPNLLHKVFENIKKGYLHHDCLILHLKGRDNIYIQFAFFPDEELVWWETVSNKYLSDHEKIPADKIQLLESMGFRLGNNPNFLQQIKINGEKMLELLAERSLEVFYLVYDSPLNPDIDFELID